MSLLSQIPSKSRPAEKYFGKRDKLFWLILLVTLLLPGLIVTRLVYLQLIEGDYYQARAESGRTRIVPRPPVRGSIFDRKGRILATSKLSHSVYLWPVVQKKPTWPATLQRLSTILNIPKSKILEKIEQSPDNASTLIRIARNLTPAQITALEEHADELLGVEVDVETSRFYPNQETASHVLGFTGELSPKQYKRLRSNGYHMSDVLGKSGVEAAFEPQLRGQWGGLMMEVDGAGRVKKLLGQKKAKPGQDVSLTIDLELQKASENALKNYKGAIVVLDPRDGAILTMASNPGYDPNIFSHPITKEIWQNLQQKSNPFLNRSLRAFPPASTFKIVTQTAGMESGKFPPNTMLNTYPYLRVAGTNFGEWNKAGFGFIGYITALSMSSNTFHGQIGRGVGGSNLDKWAKLYGFGQKSAIELSDEESTGLIPSPGWKKKYYKANWSDGDSVNMSIGQGFVQATPLQVAMMFAAQANGGYRVIPHLLKDQRDFLSKRQDLNLKPSTLRTIRSGLRGVIINGTGKALDVPYLPPIAGKSGTAEAPPGPSHTWFGAFAPFDKPEIVVVVFAEHSGGSGGHTAGPIALKVMESYFHKQAPVTKF